MMEMPEQEVPTVYSQMLQMFPDIPQDTVRQYVQLYSPDVEKCAQMLNIISVNCPELQQITAMENRKNLNECNSSHPFPVIFIPETVGDNNNDITLSNEYEDQTEQTSYDSHSSYSASLISPNIKEETPSFTNSSRNPSVTVHFNKPLLLDIVPDDEGISHSWRPSNSNDMLCPNIFVPSPVSENFQPQCSQVSNENIQEKHLEFHLNPRTVDIESGNYSMTAQMLYNYPLPDWKDSSKDITSYLHYQKSQMNAMRYEVIKAKIEFSNVKETVESLEKELKEKLQSKSVQDIVDLNKEIEKLRLDCQCLCSEIDKIDDNVEGPILLGDVNDKIEIKNKSSQDNAGTCALNPNEAVSTDLQDESNKWQCPNCTFANHPAIYVCEMCQLSKAVTRRPSFLPAPPSSSCYCHPRENTIQS